MLPVLAAITLPTILGGVAIAGVSALGIYVVGSVVLSAITFAAAIVKVAVAVAIAGGGLAFYLKFKQLSQERAQQIIQNTESQIPIYSGFQSSHYLLF